MLRNKKAIYILIPLNVVVWTFFIYRFFAAYGDTEIAETGSRTQPIRMESLKDTIVYKLNFNYKDPFLKEGFKISPNQVRENMPVSAIKKQVVPKPAVIPKQLPEVKYLGLIKNNSSGLSTALVSVNGQSRLIRANESCDGIVFKSFNRDSLVAKWGKERIVARK